MSNNIPKPPKVVVAPEGCLPWFTAGKEYPVVEIWDKHDNTCGYGICIFDDDGDLRATTEMLSAHANGNWIVKEREQ